MEFLIFVLDFSFSFWLNVRLNMQKAEHANKIITFDDENR